MHLFLTSSPCDDDVPEGAGIPCRLNRRNGFLRRMREILPAGSRCVLIAAAPEAYRHNDLMADTFQKAFAFHGMGFSQMTLIDRRNMEETPMALASSAIVILGGGHVPTQNAFFSELSLRGLLRNYRGIVMGISAGSMNCAETVYAQPEEPGESVDPAYRRFIRGLGLTHVNVLPHYQMLRDSVLDGKRLFEDISCQDSKGRTFYAIPDGSYVYAAGGKTILCGEAHRIHDGKMEQITCEDDEICI